MATFTDTVDSLWQVLLIGLLLGAGLPAIFAVGIRFLAADGATGRRSIGGYVAGAVCVVFVIAAIVTGILFIMKDFLAHSFGIHLF